MGGINYKGRKPPPLKNKAESCYMNSIMQALGSCDKLKEDLEELERENSSKKLNLFIRLLSALNTKSAQKEFDDFMLLYGWFKTGQQDSYELMSYIINSIYNELKENKCKIIDVPNKTLFPGVITMYSQTNCGCESKNINILQDLALHLPLDNSLDCRYNIQDMIHKLFQNTEVDDPCDSCHLSQTLSIDLEKTFPRTLCLHIQANKFESSTQTMIKPNYTIWYPYKLDVHGSSYELVSFLDHTGGVSIGHYVAYRHFKGRWFRINDDNVDLLPSVKDPSQYCNHPYVLFYEII